VRIKSSLLGVMILGMAVSGYAQSPPDPSDQERDLYVVGTAHLDTQWRWTIQNTINEFVPATFRENFKLMDLHPDYKFSFEGAFRYMLLKEYYPEEYEKLKKYIDRGQWRVAGSWIDAVDVNIPSFESLVRQTLYGNGFFKQEFGKTSKDIFLPDCFGFGYALPSIARHCGLESFSTQKLTWGSAYGVPFDIGIWQGVDGSSIVAALNPGSYVSEIHDDLSRDTTWLAKINKQGEESGLYAAYRYFGTGDTGGSPDSLSVDWLEKSIKGRGPIKVHSIGSDNLPDIVGERYGVDDMGFVLKTWDMPNSFTPSEQAKLKKMPKYKGELVMTRHGVGCYTSEAAMKRWNRKNELLADATERACVISHLLGAEYPREDLRDIWVRFLWHQFHDDLTGTSIPEAYRFSWNDEILCQNRLKSILTNAVEITASAMDTRAKGIPVVVYNSLSIERQDIVEASIDFDKAPEFARVYKGKKEVPSQVTSVVENTVNIIFLADVPSVGYDVYDVRPSDKPCSKNTGLKITESSLENDRYLVKVNKVGQVESIFDKSEKRELLSEPIALQFLHDKPDRWPAWEIQYEDIIAPPLTGVIKSTNVEVEENGPARVSLLVTQRTDNSTIRTKISLAAGEAGNRVQFDNDIDWYEREMLLKVAFPVSTPNDSVTYDIGLGVIKRGLDRENLYEVPGQQWADITAKDGRYGIAILNDCKYGWDHPDSATLRLSLIHTPGVYENWNWVGDQKSQDNGHHEFKFAVGSHKGDWREGGVVWQAARLNEPMMAFQTTEHKGNLGKSFSLVKLEKLDKKNPQVKITALKMAEESNDIIIRLQDLWGELSEDQPPMRFFNVEFCKANINYELVNGVENSQWSERSTDKKIVAALFSYYPEAYAVSIKPLEHEAKRLNTRTLRLLYDVDGISLDSDRTDGDFDGDGNTISGELLPDTLKWLDIPYVFGPKEAGKANVVSCEGQTLLLPSGFEKVNLLVTSTGGPSIGTFKIDGKETIIPIQDYATPIGQWNSRLVGDLFSEEPDRIAPGYVLPAPVAWYGTHRHTAEGENEAYIFTYLFLVSFDLPADYDELTLPDNERIQVLAATMIKPNRPEAFAATQLMDRTNSTLSVIRSDGNYFVDSLAVKLSTPIPGAEIRYTLDNSIPDENSPMYAGRIILRETSTVKSMAYLPGADNHYVTEAAFNRLIPRDAVAVEDPRPGLEAEYFEGEWSKLPDFDSLEAVKEFTSETIGIPDFAREEDFGLTLDGYIRVPKDGLYTFYLSSDDGSHLYIADTLVVDNDGLHGSGDVAGQVALKTGLHPINIDMFQAKGDRDLHLSVEGPGFEKEQLTGDFLFYENSANKKE
jgi:alpha-mannosidase